MNADVERVKEMRLSGHTCLAIAAAVNAPPSRIRYILGCLLDSGEITPAREPWTGEGLRQVDEMTRQGLRPREIAEAIGRTPCAVRAARPWSRRGAGRRCSAWTAEDDAALIEMRAEGLTYEHIAMRLERTAGACARRRGRINAKSR